MPLLHQQNISANTKLAVWKIEEEESFFLQKASLQQPIRHPHKRLQHLAGRYLLSLLFPLFPKHDVQVADTRKPFLPSGEYFFSISHCGDYAAAIIGTEKEVGVDIELFSAKTNAVKHKFLSEDELSFVNALSITHALGSNGLYTLCWCAKEAVYKWWGNGKIDFKKDIYIADIQLGKNEIFIWFEKGNVSQVLTLSVLLFNQLSVVYTVAAK